MNAYSVVALILIVLGVIGLAYGQFSFTKETHEAKLGPLELSVQDRETVNVPQWVGVGAVLVGVALLFVGARAKSGVGI